MSDARSNRWRRWGRRVIVGVVGLGAVLLLLYVTVAPVVVERLVIRMLDDMGFEQTEATLTGLSWKGVSFGDVRLGAGGRLRVASVHAGFSLDTLLAGRVEELTLVGVEWEVTVREGEVDFAPIHEVLARAGGGEQAAEGARLPFDRVTLEQSWVVVHHGSTEDRIPIAAWVDAGAGGDLTVAANVRWRGEPVLIRGSFNAATSTARGRITLPEQASDLSDDGPWSPNFSEADGEVQPLGVEWAVVDGGAGQPRRLRIRPFGQLTELNQHVAGRHAMLRGVQASGEATVVLGSDVGLASGDLRVEAGAIGWGDRMFEDVVLRVVRHQESPGTTVEVSARVSGTGRITIAADVPSGAAGWRETMEAPVRVAAHLPDIAGGLAPRFDMTFRRPAGSEDGAAAWRLSLDRLRFEKPADHAAALPGGLTIGEVHGDISSRGDLSLHAGAIAVGGDRFRAPDLNLKGRWPLPGSEMGDASQAAQLRLTTGHWSIDGVEFPGFSASLGQADDETRGNTQDASYRLEMSWPLTHADEGPAITGSGSIRLDGGHAVGRLNLNLETWSLTPDTPLSQLLSRVGKVRVTGDVAARAALRWDASGFSPDVTLELSDAQVARVTGESDDDRAAQRLTGVSGSLTLYRLWPPASPGGQRLQWTGGQLGQFQLGPGSVDYRLEHRDSILVEHAEVDARENGRFRVHAFRFNPAVPRYEFELFAEDLNLQSWLDLIARDYVSGQGTLYGRIPVTVSTEPTLTVDMGSGFLVAEPGGTLRVKDTAAARAMLERRLAQLETRIEAGSPVELKELVLNALQDFQYDRLRFRFVPRDDQLDMRVFASGKGLGEPTVPIGGLELNINNFGAWLNEVLRLYGGFGEGVDQLEAGIESQAPERNGAADDDQDDAIMDLFR